jgi:hypothetical protein
LNDDAWHVPSAAQYCEQHWTLAVQWFPRVRPQVVWSVPHFPPEQVPLQQSPAAAHAAPSDAHVKWQTPPAQSPVQQSPFDAQAAPRFKQFALPVSMTPSPVDAAPLPPP